MRRGFDLAGRESEIWANHQLLFPGKPDIIGGLWSIPKPTIFIYEE